MSKKFTFLIVSVLLASLLAFSANAAILKNITFQAPSELQERVVFELDEPAIPNVFSLKGKNPRVVFDFKNTKPARVIKNTINTNGKFIKTIRIGLHSDPSLKTRAVFDLRPGKEIDFKQKFNKKTNTLTITLFHTGTEGQIKKDAIQKTRKKETNKNKKILTRLKNRKQSHLKPKRALKQLLQPGPGKSRFLPLLLPR